MTFQVHALSEIAFARLFEMSDQDLAGINVRRETVLTNPGTLCRVSLADETVGETVILANYQHQPGANPYQASHAIYVRQSMVQARPERDVLPDVLFSRVISVRMFDADHVMIDADIVDGRDLTERIPVCFQNQAVPYIHLHRAKPGCFAAHVTKVN